MDLKFGFVFYKVSVPTSTHDLRPKTSGYWNGLLPEGRIPGLIPGLFPGEMCGGAGEDHNPPQKVARGVARAEALGFRAAWASKVRAEVRILILRISFVDQ